MKDALKVYFLMTKKLLHVTTIVEQALIQAVLKTVRRRAADPSGSLLLGGIKSMQMGLIKSYNV
jgi:hypothetical protein